MAASFYYAQVDENGVLCVDQLAGDSPPWTEDSAARHAERYPATIYFIVDNAIPERRVPQ